MGWLSPPKIFDSACMEFVPSADISDLFGSAWMNFHIADITGSSCVGRFPPPAFSTFRGWVGCHRRNFWLGVYGVRLLAPIVPALREWVGFHSRNVRLGVDVFIPTTDIPGPACVSSFPPPIFTARRGWVFPPPIFPTYRGLIRSHSRYFRLFVGALAPTDDIFRFDVDAPATTADVFGSSWMEFVPTADSS